MTDTLPGATYEKKKSRRDYSVVDAIDPHDGGLWDVLVSPGFLEWVKKRGMGRTKELAYSARWVLLNPAGLYRGVRDTDHDVDDEGWLCYSAIPPDAYDYKTGERRDPWSNQTMMVCVTDERVLYDWWWVPSDPESPNLPINHQLRFREKIF